MSDRERLLAAVLSDMPHGGVVVRLSASRELGAAVETASRLTKATGYHRVPRGRNTYEEARDAKDWGYDELVLVTSAYHQLRAFLTFVAVFGHSAKIWNAPAPSGWDKLDEEFDKIARYQARGHVAAFATGLAYLAWRNGT